MPCPNKEFCPAKISINHYREYCLSEDNWRSCKNYVDYQMTPAQWSKYVGDSTEKKSGLF